MLKSTAKKRRQLLNPPRRVMPTGAGMFALLAPVVLGVAAVTATNNLLLLILGAVIGCIALSGVLAQQNLRSVAVRLETISPVYCDEVTKLSVRFKRDEKRTIPSFELRFREQTRSIWAVWLDSKFKPPQIIDLTLPVLDSSQQTMVAERIFEQRGAAKLRSCELISTYPFGLLLSAQRIEPELDIWVRPRRITPPQLLKTPPGGQGEGLASEFKGLGSDLYGLREREERDPAHRVHAMRSMALGQEVVLEMTALERPKAHLGLYNHRDSESEAFERALEVIQAALNSWHQQGWAVFLHTLDSSSNSSEGGLDTILDTLARIETRAPEDSLSSKPTVWIVPQGAPRPPVAKIIWIDDKGQLQEDYS